MIELVYKMSVIAGNYEDEVTGVQPWTVDVRQVDLDSDEYQDNGAEGKSVGELSIAVVTDRCLAEGRAFIELDAINQDLCDIGSFFLDEDNDNGLKEDFPTEMFGSIVILEQMHLDSSVRGRGLGPLVASEVMMAFAGLGCTAALGLASSHAEGSGEDDPPSPETRDKLCALWEQAGMRRVDPQEGYLFADLCTQTVAQAHKLARDRCALL